MSEARDAASAIRETLAQRGVGRSICPSEAARALAGEEWRRVLPQVRRTALAMAAAGEIVVLRKGKPVDSAGVRGVIRLRLP